MKPIAEEIYLKYRYHEKKLLLSIKYDVWSKVFAIRRDIHNQTWEFKDIIGTKLYRYRYNY